MRSSVIGVVITIIILSYFIPKPSEYENQIKALAFSYGIYNHHSVCPNSKKLDLIKDEYTRHNKHLKFNDKKWIDQNFKPIFKKECEKFEIKRSGDDYA